MGNSELLDRPPPHDLDAATVFLRRLGELSDPHDERVGVLIRRIEGDVLELLIRAKRREVGVKHG